jgi:pimeloyl-ACP methyl ester carboxylesterase
VPTKWLGDEGIVVLMMILSGHRFRLIAVGGLVGALIAALALMAEPSPAVAQSVPGTRGRTIIVGRLTLTRCRSGPVGYCGSIPVPLDYSLTSGPTIKIAFLWYPATSPSGGVSGTVMPVEGGPGYPSIGSDSWYRIMYGSLLRRYNMLTVDLRGTGSSTDLDCPGLQNWTGQASGSAFNAEVAACANRLDHRWRSAAGTYAHASDLFTSAPAAHDVATVIRALGIPMVDVYGDSYGSFFAQVFANRYPSLVRSVVLDSTYETQDLDPWYRSTIDNMPAAYDAACGRSPACAQATTGPAWDDIEALAARLRHQPISGDVPGPNGDIESVTMNVVGLVDLTNDGAGDPDIYRDLDAAARALLMSGDPDPLLRLYAERASQENYFNTPATVYSGELYQAVSCLDYPQLFDMDTSPAARASELSAAIAALPASTFYPFTTQEWLAQDQNTEAYTSCEAWPSPIDPESPTVGQPLLTSSIPVLILGGELDTWTPPADVPKVMAQLGGNSRFVELTNSTHVVAEDDTQCGDDLVQEFVSAPQQLDTMTTSCSSEVPPIHCVGAYPESLATVVPLTAEAGNAGSRVMLELAAAAVATAGDAVARFAAVNGTLDHGLHGGIARDSHGGADFALTGDVLIPGVAVSGRVRMSAATVTAKLSVSAIGQDPARFEARWAVGGGAGALAQVTGSSNAQAIVGSMYAP